MDEVINYFKELSMIPRETKNEKSISDWICQLAKRHGLDVEQDNMWNVIVHKSASSDCESKEKLIFQSHLDMVCEKVIGSNHNFNKDGIEIIEYIDNSKRFFKANGTTLGADDGIGVAIMLMFMLNDEIKMPETYYIFTTQEEVGMYGAKALDISKVDAKYLINLDSETEGVATIGCAGGVNLNFSKKDNQMPTINPKYKLEISGLKGGHSGVEIDKGRINSNYLVAMILDRINNLQIASMVGGTKDNVICSSTEVFFSTDMVEDEIKQIIDEIINVLHITEEDNGLIISLSKATEIISVYSLDVSKEIVNLILNLKQGVIEMSTKLTDLVESSGNIGIVKVSEQEIIIKESIRSSVDEKKRMYAEINKELAKLLKFDCVEEGEYPGWDVNFDSELQRIYVDCYKKVHGGVNPKLESIHAGLECGLFAKMNSKLDIISIGPNLYDVHSPNERLDIESVEDLLNTLLEMMKIID